MEVRVRRATEADLAAAGQVTVDAYREDGFVPHDSDYLHELADAARRSREAELWVAVDGEAVVGTVTFCRPGTPFAELARSDEAEFRMLGVARPARRRGIAEALVVRCIERARELGYHGLVLSSMAEMAAAHRLYHRLGFRRDSRRDWSPVPGVELLAFRLDLGETPAHR
jgi:ribosomal protein S18 acetylase RimI-like enzyme